MNDLNTTQSQDSKQIPLKGRRTIGLIFLVIVIVLAFLWLVAKKSVRLLRYIPPKIKIENEISPGADTVLYFQPEKTEAKSNTTVPLLVKINSGQNQLAGIEIGLKFDPKLLEAISVIPGDFFKPVTIVNQKINNTAGTVFFTLLCPPQQPQQGEGSLALINFKIKKADQRETAAVEFLPQSKAAAVKESKNVLKSTQKAVISIVD